MFPFYTSGLSPAAVQRRVKRMREQQIISSDVSIVNAKALGSTMTLRRFWV